MQILTQVTKQLKTCLLLFQINHLVDFLYEIYEFIFIKRGHQYKHNS